LTVNEDAKVAATSVSADTLADTLWTEMAKWQAKSPLLSASFTWTRQRIFNNRRRETWWMSARKWARSADPASLGQTLAGLHSDYILFLLDESGGIPDAVMATAEAALAGCVEGHIVQAGNPTHLEGPLWRACSSERRLWHLVEITADPDDPKRSSRVPAQWAREQIEKYGRDNPWVLVNVFGRFPPHSLDTLIGPDECEAATRRVWTADDIATAPRILGVDVARFGDDASVIFPRQGLVAFPPIKVRHIDGTQAPGWWRASGRTGRPTPASSTTPAASARAGSTTSLGSAAPRSASPSRAARQTRATRTSGRRCISNRSTGSGRAASCRPVRRARR